MIANRNSVARFCDFLGERVQQAWMNAGGMMFDIHGDLLLLHGSCDKWEYWHGKDAQQAL